MIKTTEIYTQKLFKKYLPEILKNHSKDYDLFFLTVTFRNTFENLSKSVFEHYFGRLFNKLNQNILNNPSKHLDKKAIMLLFPEASYAGSCKMSKSPHYHGIIMIRKELTEKFLRKCLTAFKEKVNSYDKLVKYSNFQLTFQNSINKWMKSYSNEIQPVCDIDKLCGYITKSALNLPAREGNYSLEQAREFQKRLPEFRVNTLLENDNITSDDYLMFI